MGMTSLNTSPETHCSRSYWGNYLHLLVPNDDGRFLFTRVPEFSIRFMVMPRCLFYVGTPESYNTINVVAYTEHSGQAILCVTSLTHRTSREMTL